MVNGQIQILNVWYFGTQKCAMQSYQILTTPQVFRNFKKLQQMSLTCSQLGQKASQKPPQISAALKRICCLKGQRLFKRIGGNGEYIQAYRLIPPHPRYLLPF
jgi:hypothetical protein